MVESNYHQFCLFVFMTLSDCNNFILFSLFAIPRMGTILVYIQFFILNDIHRKNREHIFILMSFVHLCSSLYFHNKES